MATKKRAAAVKGASVTPASDRKIVNITVRPGDWGKKFISVHNRDVDKSWCRQMVRSWDTVTKSTVTLHPFDETETKWIIIDGQHRIYAASEVLKKSTTFYAEIRADIDNVRKEIELENKGKKHNIADRLRIYEDMSSWPKVFKSFKLEPVHAQSKFRYSWKLIVAADLTAADYINTGNRRRLSQNMIMDRWTQASEQDIAAIAEFLKWWEPAVDYAHQSRGLYLASYAVLTWMYVMWFENYGNSALKGLPQKMAQRPFMEQLRGMTASKFDEVGDILLRSANYQRRVNLLTLRGSSGRLEDVDG